jgi:hypothetical protein
MIQLPENEGFTFHDGDWDGCAPCDGGWFSPSQTCEHILWLESAAPIER